VRELTALEHRTPPGLPIESGAFGRGLGNAIGSGTDGPPMRFDVTRHTEVVDVVPPVRMVVHSGNIEPIDRTPSVEAQSGFSATLLGRPIGPSDEEVRSTATFLAAADPVRVPDPAVCADNLVARTHDVHGSPADDAAIVVVDIVPV
jgi:hypothetical protein